KAPLATPLSEGRLVGEVAWGCAIESPSLPLCELRIKRKPGLELARGKTIISSLCVKPVAGQGFRRPLASASAPRPKTRRGTVALLRSALYLLPYTPSVGILGRSRWST